MIDIIIFALLAFFIGRRLYKALGDTKHDNELSEENKKAYQQFKESLLKDAEPIEGEAAQIYITSAMEAEMNEEERGILDAVRDHTPDFTADKFVRGAGSAFEIILKAYAEQDKSTLQRLVADAMLDKFMQDIDHLQSNAQKRNIAVVSILSTKILSVIRQDSRAMIKVKFESEQISNIVDTVSGELVSGSASRVIKCVDTWTFAKTITSKSKNWILISNDS